MKQLGYYAKDKNNDLFRFAWNSTDDFFIFINGIKILANPNDFEIIEVGYFTGDSN